jgi:hypothetical protein
VECSGATVVALSLGGNNLQGAVPWEDVLALRSCNNEHLKLT